jgi:hypothetical protein
MHDQSVYAMHIAAILAASDSRAGNLFSKNVHIPLGMRTAEQLRYGREPLSAINYTSPKPKGSRSRYFGEMSQQLVTLG